MKTRPAPSTLTEDQLAAFERDGFLAIDNVVPPEDLAPIETEYAELLDRLATDLYARGASQTPITCITARPCSS